jgi:hypothetical protein
MSYARESLYFGLLFPPFHSVSICLHSAPFSGSVGWLCVPLCKTEIDDGRWRAPHTASSKMVALGTDQVPAWEEIIIGRLGLQLINLWPNVL